jgi:TIR domain
VSAPIFISYSSKDQDIAETICQALEARGLECWISCRDVDPGQNFQEAIVRALRSAQIMLLVFTANANNSDEIKKELVLAGRHRVAVVPFRVEDVVPNDALAYELATRQWIDLFKDWEQEIERLAVGSGRSCRPGKRRGAATPKRGRLPLRDGASVPADNRAAVSSRLRRSLPSCW